MPLQKREGLAQQRPTDINIGVVAGGTSPIFYREILGVVRSKIFVWICVKRATFMVSLILHIGCWWGLGRVGGSEVITYDT
jgi:membrane-associated PAP2 superfamily phosphatase